MGCDIHLYGEKLDKPKWWQLWKKEKWISIDKWVMEAEGDLFDDEKPSLKIPRDDKIYTDGRNYNLFCALCGVRSYEFTGHPPRVSEPKGFPKDCCREIKTENESWGSDGHSHSWLTLQELKNFDWSPYGKTCDRFINQVYPKLELHGKPDEVRIVFWFDN